LNPDLVSREFCVRVFGEENLALGELFEAFEVVKGWGHYPRRKRSKQALTKAYTEIIDCLEAADPNACSLPLFPDPDEYRRDLLWFARKFLAMAGEAANREAIRKEYRDRAYKIYDSIPESVAEITVLASTEFSRILEG
jgi:hypothetical protein